MASFRSNSVGSARKNEPFQTLSRSLTGTGRGLGKLNHHPGDAGRHKICQRAAQHGA
jgi:hypothetical protein